ncbi:hypothetical protein TWF694_007608 [Orbilia ellipsospora]|uniref:Uncharacterized protein n=1 Tax=Orbilia ellipsospora TaxID=2528407 RepID=A0AAV9XIR3_9PEZI
MPMAHPSSAQQQKYHSPWKATRQKMNPPRMNHSAYQPVRTEFAGSSKVKTGSVYDDLDEVASISRHRTVPQQSNRLLQTL